MTLPAALALALAAAPAAGEAVFMGSYVWTGEGPDFGGWSGFDTDAGGVAFRAVSDIGLTVAGTLTRDAEGRVTGVQAGPTVPLRGDEAEVLAPHVRDGEGLAILPDGSFAVSFEGEGRNARVVTEADTDAPAVILLDGRGLDMGENKGFEALAVAADGTLLVIEEEAQGLFGGHRVWAGEGRDMSVAFEIPRDGTWRVAGADVGPDGRLYVMERDFWPFLGFQSRVLRMSPDAAGAAAAEVLFTTRAGRHDNLEGIAVWTDAGGALRLTMISDDNLRRSQHTEIVDYRIAD
jgi:hypothetical protein